MVFYSAYFIFTMKLLKGLYKRLGVEAYSRSLSMTALVRKVLGKVLANSFGIRKGKGPVEDFSFIGVGETDQGALAPVSERHDKALEEAMWDGLRRLSPEEVHHRVRELGLRTGAEAVDMIREDRDTP